VAAKRSVREALASEAFRYLATVEAFRSAGIEPHYLSEQTERELRTGEHRAGGRLL
jgi:hypothetical protein